MKRTKNRVDIFCEALARLVITHRTGFLITTLLISVFLGYHLRSLQFDTSNEGFLHEGDPILATYNEFRELFGRDDMLVLAIEGPDIFSRDFLLKLKTLHQDLRESVPHLEDVSSMVNARNTRGEGDVLLVDDLLAEFPETAADLENLRRLVMTNPLYRNQLVSEDGRFTTVLIQSAVYSAGAPIDIFAGFDESTDPNAAARTYLSDRENDEFVQAIVDTVRRHQADSFTIHTAGPPLNLYTIKIFMQRDALRFMQIAAVVIALCLFLMFRRASGVILPLLVVGLSVLSTVGLMSFLGVSFKLPTTILPAFLLTVGVGASVHVLSLTYQNMRNGYDRQKAVIAAFSHSGFAICMTSFTTAVGLASFAFASVAPIADLGKYSAIGVLISLLYTFTLLPALISAIPLRPAAVESTGRTGRLDRLLDDIASFSVRRYRPILGVTFGILLVSLGGVRQLLFSHDALVWLPEDLDVRQATELYDRELKGSVVLEIILDTGVENGLYDREVLLDIEEVMQSLEMSYREGDIFIGKTISVTTILKEIHQALHGNDPAYYRIPENPRLIPQEFLLFENSGSDDLQEAVDSQFRLARITLKVPWQDALLYVPFIKDVTGRFSQAFSDRSLEGGEPMQVTATGIMSLFGRIIHAAMYSAAQSYGIALVVITVLMVLLIGNLKLGFISMIPNLGPIFVVLGIMGWFGIRLDMFTMLIASIAIGIAVDDTIHFMYNFRRYYEQSGDVEEAVTRTLQTAGRAMLTTSVVLALGFFIFVFSSMNNLFNFGILTGAAIVLALAADLLLAPALMRLVLGGKQPPSSPLP